MELDESMILITSTGPAAEYACNILIFYLNSTDFKSLGHGTLGPWDFFLLMSHMKLDGLLLVWTTSLLVLYIVF